MTSGYSRLTVVCVVSDGANVSYVDDGDASPFDAATAAFAESRRDIATVAVWDDRRVWTWQFTRTSLGMKMLDGSDEDAA